MKELFYHSDLAMECDCEEGGRGICAMQSDVDGYPILRVQIKTPEVAAATGRPMGHYVTVECGNIAMLDSEEAERIGRIVGVELKSMAERLCGKRIGREFSLLAVGLGNRRSTVDAVGPEAVMRLTVTRGRECTAVGSGAFSATGLCRISAIEPGVSAVTGLKTVELLRGLVEQTGPDLVLAVDALTARSVERLGSTVQLSDGGIRPASGVGRGHCELDDHSIGAPVIALGIPTAVRSDAMVWELLRRAGVKDADLAGALQAVPGHLVTVGEIDLLVQSAGALLARIIERAFSVS